MTKLTFPTEGLKRLIKGNAESTSSYLNNAISKCPLRVPQDFSYYKYLTDLQTILKKFKTEADSINTLSGKVDNTYSTLDRDMKTSAQNLVVPVIKERDRSIVL